MPSSEYIEEGDKITENLELVVKFTTKLKLDLIDQEGNRIVKDRDEPEVHFLRFEAIVEEHDADVEYLLP